VAYLKRLEPIENPFARACPCLQNEVFTYVSGIDQEKMARCTGRFPQLLDPRSSVNGLFLTGSPGFREVSLEERGSLCRLKQSAADNAPLLPRWAPERIAEVIYSATTDGTDRLRYALGADAGRCSPPDARS
jgi:hypothetical protein